MARKRYRAVILDVDGTLYRSRSYETHLQEKIVETLADMMAVNPREAGELLEGVKRATKTVSGAVETLGLDRHEFYRRLAARVAPSQYISSDERVVALLRFLRSQGLKVVLHTNSGRDLALKVLNTLGIDSSCYDILVTSDDAEPKPSSQPYRYILERLGVGPGEVLYVGDRYEVELEPAKKMGMDTALVHGRGKSHPVDYSISSVLDLYNLLG
ncbi:Phosphoglycolate phosphatase [archaeon HR01]|nr:Phosphoglycolate phosphatase [archaeon HR01]